MAAKAETVVLAAPPGTSSMPKKKSSFTAGCGVLGVAFAGADLLGVFLGVFPVLIVDAANMSSKPPHSSCGDGVLAFGRAGASGVRKFPGQRGESLDECECRGEYLCL